MARQKDTVADSLRRGLEQARTDAGGTADRSADGVHVPEGIDVRASPTRLDLTQDEFAGRYGFSVNTLRHGSRGNASRKGRRERVCR